MKLDLHIQQLVLDGLPLTPAQAARVRVALEFELGRLFSAGNDAHLLRGSGAMPRLAAPQIDFATSHSPEVIGRRIARSLHAGIGGAA